MTGCPRDDARSVWDGIWDDGVCDLSGVMRVAELLALDARRGDVILLRGDLGAGKTTFATAFLRGFYGQPDLTVPSPTFTLVERYEGARGVVHHADLYRLEMPEELAELGLEDARDEGVLLVEWPERAEGAFDEETLEVSLVDVTEENAEGDGVSRRRLVISGGERWQERLARLQHIDQFLDGAAQPDERLSYLQGDASARRYGLLRDGGGQLRVVMDSPAQVDAGAHDGAPAYSRIASLAETTTSFAAVAIALRRAGISVPRIDAHDAEFGLMLIEHLGFDDFRVLAGDAAAVNGAGLREAYSAAIDVLVHLAQHPPLGGDLFDGLAHRPPFFSRTIFEAEALLFVDWALPPDVASGAESARAAAIASFRDLIASLYDEVDDWTAWVLRDFHSPNLIWRPHLDGTARVGVIDFQDALVGPAAYDVVSLLQDARLTVPEALEAELIARYITRTGCDATAFRREYAVLGAQRATKILGIFARLSRRDGKHGYLAHVPRIWGYLERNLRHPALMTLQQWYDQVVPRDARLAD
ncbi:MAG: tRNA (adenosine(37)-N6)-threonylcarbamoyltransferase complex ATPase subunit type 1 TsaE [Pseudomonadota bacterium]